MYYSWCMNLKRVHNVFSFHAMIYRGILCWVSQSYLLLSGVSDKDLYVFYMSCVSLQWRHNGRDSVSNHQPHHCLLNRLFRHRSKKTQKLRVTGLCAGNSPVTGEFPAQMASRAENVSIWWRHHALWSPLTASYREHFVDIWPVWQWHYTFHFIQTPCLAHPYILPAHYHIPSLHCMSMYCDP